MRFSNTECGYGLKFETAIFHGTNDMQMKMQIVVPGAWRLEELLLKCVTCLIS